MKQKLWSQRWADWERPSWGRQGVASSTRITTAAAAVAVSASLLKHLKWVIYALRKDDDHETTCGRLNDANAAWYVSVSHSFVGWSRVLTYLC